MEVLGLNPEFAMDYYDDDLFMHCRANQEMAYFVYGLIDQYLLPFLAI